MRLLPALMLCASVAAMPACASRYDVRTDWDRQADFSAWRTWAWDADDATSTPAGRRVRTAVADELAAKGFRQGAAADADFLVSAHVSTRRDVDVIEHVDPFWAGRHFWGGPSFRSVSVFEIDVGVLVLDAIDRRGGFVAWRGVVEAEVDRGLSPEDREKRTRDAVREMLEDFPPR